MAEPVQLAVEKGVVSGEKAERRFAVSARQIVTTETIESVSSQLAGLPITPALAAKRAVIVEALMTRVETLRSLPIKELAPPLTFAPEEDGQ